MSKTVLYNGKVYVERDVFAQAVLQEPTKKFWRRPVMRNASIAREKRCCPV